MKDRFEILMLDEVLEFVENLEEKTRDKITYNIRKSKYINDPKLFKKLRNKIWEFRTEYRNLQYRLFAFWDKRNKKQILVISTHGIVKKKQKVSKAKIDKAIRIMNQYFNK